MATALPARAVKLYPELGRLANATGEDRLLRVWYGLRALDDGTGWLSDDASTREALLALGVAGSCRSLRAILKAGEGLYWRRVVQTGKRRAVVELVGLGPVCGAIYQTLLTDRATCPYNGRVPFKSQVGQTVINCPHCEKTFRALFKAGTQESVPAFLLGVRAACAQSRAQASLAPESEGARMKRTRRTS